MKINIFDIDEFIKVNNCKEVTNGAMFNPDKTPTEDGLFSYDIFGHSELERKSTFGYINLYKPFFNPVVFSLLNKRMGSIKDIIAGKKYAIINTLGQIVYTDEKTPGAKTGIAFFYDNFGKNKWTIFNKGTTRDKIELDPDDLTEDDEELVEKYRDGLVEDDTEDIESLDKKTRLKFLRSLKKNEMFITKLLVLPPFYRDMKAGSVALGGDDINKVYKNIILRAKALRGGGVSMFGLQNDYLIQMKIDEAYTNLTNIIKGKESLFRQAVVGKIVDYGTSNVIASPIISGFNKPNEVPVKFGVDFIPLASILSLYRPFIETATYDLLQQIINALVENIKYNRLEMSIDITKYDIAYVKKLINNYIKNPACRLDYITINIDDKKSGESIDSLLPIVEADNKDFKNPVERYITLTDLLFMTADAIIKDGKYVYTTRFPIINVKSVYPSKASISTTPFTKKAYIGIAGKENDIKLLHQSDIYPLIAKDITKVPENEKSKYALKDVLNINNVYLPLLDGDYDGDMLYMRGVFTKEAEEEAQKMIYSKTNFVSSTGRLTRNISDLKKEIAISAFEFTKEIPLKK